MKIMAHADTLNTIRKLISSGKVKTKGAYEVLPFDKLGFHKNHSAMVIPMAVLSELIGLESAVTFLENHNDPYDFLLRTKVPRSSRLVLCYDDGNEELQQNICRYYPSEDGGKLVKIMPPLIEGEDERRLGIDTTYKVKTCNNINDFDWNLNYNYYLAETQKLIDMVLQESEN